MAETADKPRCVGTNRAGEPCGAAPLKGTDRCRAHPIEPDQTRFGSPEQAAEAGASPKPARKLTTILLRKLEEHADELVDELLRLTSAEKTVLLGKGEDAEIVDVPDNATRLRAITEIYDRAEGKARQALELTGEEGGPIEHAAAGGLELGEMTDEELDTLREIRARARDRAHGDG